MAKYTHTAKSISDQIALLKSRGLVIRDEDEARAVLSNISYFRLACYLRYFESDHNTHTYNAGTTFEQVVELYTFDSKLRDIIFSAIQSIEIALRSKVVQHYSTTLGPFWFAKAKLFNDRGIHRTSFAKLKHEISRSKEDFIIEYSAKYSSPAYPPAWKSMEVASFGTLSNFYSNLKDTACKKAVAKEFALPKYDFLVSWIQCATVLRNCCAHHARVWNRRFAVNPTLPAYLPNPWISNRPQPIKVYSQLCYLEYLIQSITPHHPFKLQLKDLLSQYPSVDTAAMGFPANWQNEPL